MNQLLSARWTGSTRSLRLTRIQHRLFSALNQTDVQFHSQSLFMPALPLTFSPAWEVMGTKPASINFPWWTCVFAFDSLIMFWVSSIRWHHCTPRWSLYLWYAPWSDEEDSLSKQAVSINAAVSGIPPHTRLLHSAHHHSPFPFRQITLMWSPFFRSTLHQISPDQFHKTSWEKNENGLSCSISADWYVFKG